MSVMHNGTTKYISRQAAETNYMHDRNTFLAKQQGHLRPPNSTSPTDDKSAAAKLEMAIRRALSKAKERFQEDLDEAKTNRNMIIFMLGALIGLLTYKLYTMGGLPITPGQSRSGGGGGSFRKGGLRIRS